MTTDPDDGMPRKQWRDRSHADDQGAAIELVTGMLTGDKEAVRRAVRTVHRGSAEGAGLVIGLAKIGVGLLRLIGERTDSEPVEVLQTMAPELHAEALAMDDDYGPPLPGSAFLDVHDPPPLVFMVGETMKSLAAIDRGIAHLLSPEEDDNTMMLPAEDGTEWPVPARRLMWEVMQLVSEAGDHFRGEIDWDLGEEE
jgi:hypothetical protein